MYSCVQFFEIQVLCKNAHKSKTIGVREKGNENVWTMSGFVKEEMEVLVLKKYLFK